MLEPIFLAAGLTAQQWAALVLIRSNPPQTSAGLARALTHDTGAVTRLVRALEAQGLVFRQPRPLDRRAAFLMLTPEGETVADHVQSPVVAMWTDWLSDWDQEEVQKMIGIMRKLRDTLLEKTGLDP